MFNNIPDLQQNMEALPGETVSLVGELPESGLEVVWLKGGLNCVEVLGPCNQLFLKVHRVFGEGRGITGEHDQVGVWTVESGWEFE